MLGAEKFMNINLKSNYSLLDTPCLILQESLLLKNLETAKNLSKSNHKRLRPHIKAHKSIEIAKLQLNYGAVGICCTKLSEAEVMVDGGIRDILITSPVVGSVKLERLGKLSQKAKISLVTDNEQQVLSLSEVAKKYNTILSILVEIDVGQGRCGVQPGEDAYNIAKVINQAQNLQFLGLQAYQGKLQGIKRYSDRLAAVNDAMQKLANSLEYFKKNNLAVEIITGGGTGSFPIDVQLPFLNELQLGSYVTMDCNYALDEWDTSGKKKLFCQPLSILSTVISKPMPNKVIVDAGWKAVTNDGGMPITKNIDYLFEYGGDEHGIITCKQPIINLEIGDQVELIPSHCDTTINLYNYLYLVNHLGSRQVLIQARGMVV